jgi:hypothetical protein
MKVEKQDLYKIVVSEHFEFELDKKQLLELAQTLRNYILKEKL